MFDLKDVRNLRKAPGHEGEDQPGEERSDRVPGDLPRERPRAHRGKEHAEEEKVVVDEERRGARREERKAEDGGAEQVLGEGESVTGGVKDVGLEEMERVAEDLVEVPVKDPRVQLGVPEVPEAASHPHGLGPGENDGRSEEENGGEEDLPRPHRRYTVRSRLRSPCADQPRRV